MNEVSGDDGNYLVRVRAQVMTRDDSTGGWLPMGGGGLSNVSVRKRLLSSSSVSSVTPGSNNNGLLTSHPRGSSSYSAGGNGGGGGGSNLCGSDEDIETAAKHEYLIFGKRISDSCVVLCCPIRKDFQYNKVMPTFHHWKTADKKYGLTFQTASDARAFDKGVRRAVEDLLEGIGEFCFHDTDIGDDDVFMTLELPVDSRSSSGSSSASGGVGSSSGVVVTAATLSRHPLNPMSSIFPTGNDQTALSFGGNPYGHHPASHHHHLHRMHFIRSSTAPGAPGVRAPPSTGLFGSSPDKWTPGILDLGGGSIVQTPPTLGEGQKDLWVPYPKGKSHPEDRIEILASGQPYSYVQFAKDNKLNRTEQQQHEYCYPVMDPLKITGPGLNACSGSLKKVQPQTLMLPTKCKKKDYFGRSSSHGRCSTMGSRAQCRHCLEMYSREDNGKGSCEYAPDSVLACINGATCISCAQCMLYHCMSDAEGDFDQHPCSCDGNDEHCQRRWASMAILSLLVPCLWCYLPLRACHKCAVGCRACGGRHQPM